MDIPEIRARFGTAVKSRRGLLGISQEELAGRAGLHRTYVADVERGARNLSLESISKLAAALEISIPRLFAEPETGVSQRTESSDSLVDVLLVEDDLDDVELTLRAFKRANFTNRVQVVHDGAAALEFLFCTGAFAHRNSDHRPQVVLLDLNLPAMNGLEVLRRIKEDPRTRTIPVVVLTVSQRSRDITESKQLGAEAYIVKPVDFYRFSKVIPQLQFCWALLKIGAPQI